MNNQLGLLIGTNRENAMTSQVAKYFETLYASRGISSTLIDLKELPSDFIVSALYGNQGKNELFNTYQEKIDGLEKIVFFVPEYNGSFPGILKTFLDGLRYPDTMHGKKVALVGIASGVHGNAVGLSHLSDILSYMGADVLGLRLKLGDIYSHFDGKEFSHPKYNEFISQQIDKFLAF
ncbi:NAD(P)H-dependent FMN reductase [Spirosomataceae bacterium TFI 002]|nr:NAD(P)H-dependent FMN reductase [Spirosomataceae bacterium TFI 002]